MITRTTSWMVLCLLGVSLALLPASPALADDIGGGQPAETQADKANDQVQPDQQAEKADDQKADDENAEPKEPTTRPTTRPASDRSQPGWIWPLLIGMIVLWIWMGRKPRKEQKKRKEMLDNLKKGDKVTSIGGIVGTVLDVREDEITVKIDETTNTRMRFARWAIRTVGTPSEETQQEK